MRPLPDSKVLAQLISNVTKTMLGIAFQPVGTVMPARQPRWRTATLPIPGARPVTVGLSSDQASCEALCAKMFDCGADSVDDAMVDDSLRELTNMTAGLVKSTLALDQQLGLPKIVDSDLGPTSFGKPGHSVLLKADRLGLFLWVREGISEDSSCPE